MDCLECKDLRRYFDEMHAKYVAARTSAYYRVCTDLAAKREVNMERAKSALEEHREACASAATESFMQPAENSQRGSGENLRTIMRQAGTTSVDNFTRSFVVTRPY